MLKTISSERQYTIGYYKPASKIECGVSITVTGDHKTKVIREAKELLGQAIKDAKEFDRMVGR